MRTPRHAVALSVLLACGSPPGSVPDDAAREGDAPAVDGAPSDAGTGELPRIERGQAGGEAAAVAIANGRAYLGVGPRLTVWDLGGGAPSRLGETAPLAGVITAVAVSGDRAFVTAGGTSDGALHVVDVADPTHPAALAALRLGTGPRSRPTSVSIDGTSVYVADPEQGVFRVDAAVPAAPAVTAFRPRRGALQVQVVGPRVHAIVGSFLGVTLEVLDASAGLASLGSAHVSGAAAAVLTASGLAITRGSAGLAVHELADPTAPRRLYAAPGLAVGAMIPGGGGAWLTVGGQPRFLDLSDPAAITLGDPHPQAIPAVTAGAFAGDRLAVTTPQGDLEVFGVGPGSVALLGRTPTGPCAWCSAAVAAGDLLVIAETTPGAIGAVATARLSDLGLIGRHREPSADFVDLAYAGGRAYVADWFADLWVFDLTGPEAPSPSARIPTAGSPTAIAVSGDRVYLGEGGGAGALRVFSRGGPAAPVELGSIATDRVAGLAVDGDLVFAAAGGLRIHDARDPAAIQLVGDHDECTSPASVAVSGRLALLACAGVVHVIDVSTPTRPATRARWQAPLPASGGGVVDLDGLYGYYGHDRGVTVIDLAVPDAPVVAAELGTAWAVRHLAIPAPGRVIASTNRGGIYQWALLP